MCGSASGLNRTATIVTQAASGKLWPEAVIEAAHLGGQTRYLWNLFTALNNARMKECGIVFYAELSAMLRDDRKVCGLPHRFSAPVSWRRA
jgi:hypothetical protein